MSSKVNLYRVCGQEVLYYERQGKRKQPITMNHLLIFVARFVVIMLFELKTTTICYCDRTVSLRMNYTVYVCKDNRTRVYLHDSKQVISYPRFLMEQKLGRTLLADEQVHHIDGNPLNNNLDNLEIKLIGEHQREHNPRKYFDRLAVCQWCGNEFYWTAAQQSRFYRNKNRRQAKHKTANPFCSKKCVGEYGKHIQNLDSTWGRGEIGSTQRT